MKQIARVAALLAAAALLPAASAPSAGASEGVPVSGNPCVPDVETQFRRLKHHGEALGFHLRAGTPDPTLSSHYQSVQRRSGPGTPHFFLSKSGDDARLLVVRYGSRDTDGERLRSNRLLTDADTESTIPPTNDRVVLDIAFDHGDLAYSHGGGLQAYGEFLVVALEEPTLAGLLQGAIAVYDISNPGSPHLLHHFGVDHAAGTASITRRPKGRFLIAVGGANGNSELHTYISNSPDLRAPGLSFSPLDVWHESELPSGDHWPNGPFGDEAHQTLNFMEECDGDLYLVGTNNDNHHRPSDTDFVDLYRVTIDASHEIHLDHVDTHHAHCESRGGTLCNFAAAGGVYISPSGELILYGAEHENDGPGGTVRMGEFRYRDMFRPGSPLWAPTAAAGGPYSVPEGSALTLDASTSIPTYAKAWVELYDEKDFDDRSIVLDYQDRALEDWDNVNDIDDFEDRTSSVRWIAPAGCDIVLYADRYFDLEGRAVPLPGDGTIRTIGNLNSVSFGDATSSVRFEGATCAGRDISFQWDTEDDGTFDSTGATATFGATELDGPVSRTAMVRACGAFWDCDEKPPQIEVTNAPPVPAIEALRDELGRVLGADVEWILEDLEVRLDGTFTDAGKPDTHTASVDWGDGAVVGNGEFERFDPATGGAVGTATASHVYADPGTYHPAVTVTDDDGGAGTATGALEVLGAADLLEAVRDDLETAAGSPTVGPLAKRHLDRAIAKLGGHPAQNGAIDRIRAGTPNAALVMLREALEELIAAESIQPGLDFNAEKTLIVLAAKSVVMNEIDEAQALQTDEAEVLVSSGDQRLRSGDHVGAIDEYRKALAKLSG